MPRKIFLAQHFQSILECFLLNFDHFLATKNHIFYEKKVSQLTVKRSFNILMQTQLVSALNYLAQRQDRSNLSCVCGGCWRAGPEVGEGQIFSAHRGQGARYYHVAVKTCIYKKPTRGSFVQILWCLHVLADSVHLPMYHFPI